MFQKYQLTPTNLEHDYLWYNNNCGWVSVPKNANMMIRNICEHFNMDYKLKSVAERPVEMFCVVRNPWLRFVSGMAECLYRRHNGTTRTSMNELLLAIDQFYEEPHLFDEHLEPQIAYVHGYTFTKIVKFENLLNDLLKVEYLNKDKYLVARYTNPSLTQVSKYFNSIHQVVKQHELLINKVIEKYYARDYEIWLCPPEYENKLIT
jgi:hypothetical protein